MKPKETEKLETQVDRDVTRLKTAKKNSHLILAQTAYLGTLGVVIALPIVAGAYLGRWLDDRSTGFSFSWTVCLIVLGVFVGATNAYFFIKRGGS